MQLRLLCLTIVSLFAAGDAHASQLVTSALGLSVSSGESTVTFPILFDTLSQSTGNFTVGNYTISNITEEFVGSDLSNVPDPILFRLTGMDSITCNPCTDPLEIDFFAAALPDTQSGFYLDMPMITTTIGIDGSLGPGNAVDTELLLMFEDGSIFDGPLTLTPGMPFSQSASFGPLVGLPGVVGSFFLGCSCSLLAPDQVFSLPDSISVTFNTPEPANWVALCGLLMIPLWRWRKSSSHRAS